jgi:hypothetical protein
VADMMNQRLRMYLFGLLWLAMTGSSPLYGQLNLKIGYVPSFAQLTQNDQILSLFDPDDADVTDQFGSVGFLHGLQLGITYRWSSSAIEIGWESVSQEKSALAFNDRTEQFTERTYGYGISNWMIGIDHYWGNIGLGSRFTFQKLSIDRVINSNDLSLVSQTENGLRVHLNYVIQRSRFISLVLQPFYQISLSDYDLQPLISDLDISTSINNIERPRLIGLSLVFYNGRQ